MNRCRKYKFSIREGSNHGMFPSGNTFRNTCLYNNHICNECLSAFQEMVYTFKKEVIQDIKKCRKEEIRKFFRAGMNVCNHYMQITTKYISDLDVYMESISILSVFPAWIQAFRECIKVCKSAQDTCMYTLMKCIKGYYICIQI